MVSEAQRKELKGVGPLTEEQNKVLGDGYGKMMDMMLQHQRVLEAKFQRSNDKIDQRGHVNTCTSSSSAPCEMSSSVPCVPCEMGVSTSGIPARPAPTQLPKITLLKTLPTKTCGTYKDSVAFGVAYQFYCGSNPISTLCSEDLKWGKRV